jgi:DnaJ-class molecular chaperone
MIELNVCAAMSNKRAANIDPNGPLALINAIAERAQKPSEDRHIECVTCDGATRTFDDPAECPDCHGERYVVL